MAGGMYPDQRARPTPTSRYVPSCIAPALVTFLLAVALPSYSVEVVRKALDPGVMIALKGGRTLYLECRTPAGTDKASFLQRYLADGATWKRYESLNTVPLMYADLKPEMQRHVMETMFAEDFADKRGWWHTVTYEGSVGVESWWNLAEWLTGKGTDYKTLETLPENRRTTGDFKRGQVLFIPSELLLPVFRTPTPGRERRVILEPMTVAEETAPAEVGDGNSARDSDADGDGGAPFVDDYIPGELRYGHDRNGDYAAYEIKRGEALYTSVVIRFTEFREVAAVQDAAGEILRRNSISNPRKINVGEEIRIPLDMLADRYQPEGSARRLAFEEANQDALRFRLSQKHVKDLDGVVIVLDPGHGGCDQGASYGPLLEDEITYDLALRMKRQLERRTRARVYMTMMDLSQKENVSNETRFGHDTDEVVLTSPPYSPSDTKVSANLRWCLANDIYNQELARGVKPENMLFASVHCDALYEKLRGSMVYVPGAGYRESGPQLASAVYARYTSTGINSFTTTAAERRRDEALSRNFAETMLNSLRTHNPQIAVHRTSDPIRNVITRSRRERWLPAVLKHNLIPTKVLIETGNLNNDTDRERLADPEWREWYAEAFVNAVMAHFSS